MNRSFYSLLILLACSCIYACHTMHTGKALYTKDAAIVKHGNGKLYRADTSASFIKWTGKKPGGSHYGTFKLKEGLLYVDNNELGGSFNISVYSLSPQDGKKEKNELLRDHLLSNDFFDAFNFPESHFDITDSKHIAGNDYSISGNLSIRSVNKNITFPAHVTISDNVVTASANFVIDRTIWGLNYGNDRNLGNWFIYPDVPISLYIKAYTN